MSELSYPEAMVIGLLQGVSELFPVSSLGHSVLLPALVGGKWARDLDMTAPHSPYLAVLVAMHVATALALVVFFWRDWVRLIGGALTSVRERRITTTSQRLVWLLVVGTIPVGLAGLALDKTLRTSLGKPIPAAVFLALNGLVLYAVERYRRRADDEQPDRPSADGGRRPTSAGTPRVPLHRQDTVVLPVVPAGAAGPPEPPPVPPEMSTEQTAPLTAVAAEAQSDARLSRLSWIEAAVIGAVQSLALLPGISRSGITMVGGLVRGLRHEDAARFAFLLSTPVILAAGLLKIPELFQPEARAVLGPALVGSLLAGIAAYFSVRFLTAYFETRTLRPFAVYCLVIGLGSLLWFAV